MKKNEGARQNLTPKQQRLLAELIAEPTSLRDAAKNSGIPYSTAQRIWNAPEFKQALKEATEEVTREAQRKLLAILDPSVKEHHRIITDPGVSAGVKIRAIALLYETVVKLAQLFASIDDRLSANVSVDSEWIAAEDTGNGQAGDQVSDDDDSTPDDDSSTENAP